MTCSCSVPIGPPTYPPINGRGLNRNELKDSSVQLRSLLKRGLGILSGLVAKVKVNERHKRSVEDRQLAEMLVSILGANTNNNITPEMLASLVANVKETERHKQSVEDRQLPGVLGSILGAKTNPNMSPEMLAELLGTNSNSLTPEMLAGLTPEMVAGLLGGNNSEFVGMEEALMQQLLQQFSDNGGLDGLVQEATAILMNEQMSESLGQSLASNMEMMMNDNGGALAEMEAMMQGMNFENMQMNMNCNCQPAN